MKTVDVLSSKNTLGVFTLWMKSLLAVLFISILGGVLSTSARAQQENFLDPEIAFVLEANMQGPGVIGLKFKIARGYYMYREQFSFKLNTSVVTLGEGKFPEGQVKHDPTFDRKMELYFKE